MQSKWLLQTLKTLFIMPEIINNEKELLRINRTKNIIEFSRTDGRSWVLCCNCGTMYGTFHDLLRFGNEILACTSKGLYYSRTDGRSWVLRCNGSNYGEFLNLQVNGSELLANTSKGLYYSRNQGHSWVKRS